MIRLKVDTADRWLELNIATGRDAAGKATTSPVRVKVRPRTSVMDGAALAYAGNKIRVEMDDAAASAQAGMALDPSGFNAANTDVLNAQFGQYKIEALARFGIIEWEGIAEVTGGTMILRALSIDPFALPYGGNGNQMGQAFTAPLIAQVGPGVLDLQGMKLPQIGSSTGVAVQFFSDTPGNVAQGNDFGGWAYLPPATIAAGTYGPNRAPETPITPVASIVSGTMTAAYQTQTGRATLTDSGYKFDFSLQFNPTAVSGSGQLYIPLPYTLAARSQKAFALGETIGIKLDANFTQVSAVYDSTHNAVELVESGNGPTAAISQPITTANLTNNILVSLTVSGDVTAP